MRLLLLGFALLPFGVFGASGRPLDTSGVIRTIRLDAQHPYFVPTHPRVTTTLRFPGPIDAPDGAVREFTEDAARDDAEYLVSWQPGDAYFTITALARAGLANLNVPYRGCTYVFYFYPVTDQLKAAACVNLGPPLPGGAVSPAAAPAGRATPSERPSPDTPPISRKAAAPPSGFLPVTPARLIGFLDRLKLIHATRPGPALAQLTRAMGLEVAGTREELGETASSGVGLPEGLSGLIDTGLNDAGLFQVILLRAVRDPRLNSVGFICLIRNASDHVLTFDINSFGARAGGMYLLQRISDAVPLLRPGEQAPAYFVVTPSRNDPLLASNDWRISVDLVRPRLNPGASIARDFGRETVRP